MCGACEYSGINFRYHSNFVSTDLFLYVQGNQAVAMPLGLPANFTFHQRVFLFSDQAIQYVRDARLRLLDINSDSESESSIASFSSGVYSKDSSDSSDSDATFHPPQSYPDPTFFC